MVEDAHIREDNKATTSRYNVRVLERAIHLLEALADGNLWKLSDLSQTLDVSSSTVYRLLATLSHFGYVQHDEETGGYRLGLACLELAHSFFQSNDMRRIALPDLEALRDHTTETVHLGILDRWDVVYLEKLHGLHAIGLMVSTVGGRLPAYCTGIGKALLAYQDLQDVRRHFEEKGLTSYTDQTISNVDKLIDHLIEIREQGFAFDRGEHEAEVHCIGVPLRNIDGKIVGAISMSAPAGRLDLDGDYDDLVEAVKQAAESISRKLGRITGHQ